MRGISGRLWALLSALFLLTSAVAIPAGTAQTAGEVTARDRLIADQENLLNIYRCRFGVDMQVVPGGCSGGVPIQPPTVPAEFSGTPTRQSLRVRDDLIAAQEKLLNTYRCRFNIDTHVVPGACRTEPSTQSDRQQEVPATADEREPSPAGERIEWTSCGLGIKCGFVDVPVDYRQPEADTIKIAVNVRWTTSPEQRIGYLLVNPGGPGGSGVDFVASGDRFADQLLERFDIVGFDPRGVGASEPAFSCGAPGEQLELLGAIDMPIDSPSDIAAGEAAANLCIQSMGPVGGLLHSEYVARDMDEIRKALGADQISYLGFSYGSTLGVWYATLFPQSVRAMVVDGADNPVDPASTRQERIEEAIEEVAPFADSLDQALAACDDWQCPIYNRGNPGAYFRKAVTKLDLVNQAASGNPRAGVLGVLTTLYSQDYWPYLWQGLFALQENNDPSVLLELALLQLGEDPAAASFTAHVNCLDSLTLYPELDRDTLLADAEAAEAVMEERFPLLALMFPPLPSACLFYDQFAPDPLQGPLDGGNVPILVIGNHSDPVTPFGESEELATDTLVNGYLIETSHIAHGVYPNNECVNHHVHRALIDVVYPDERRVVCGPQE